MGLLDHQQKTIFVIEFLTPAEVSVVSKEEEKRKKARKYVSPFNLLTLYKA
nr:unnamed protein product [Callosobruchus chinensis]